MKIKLKIRVPAIEFPDDIIVEFESFYYFHFEDMLEAFPNSKLPSSGIYTCVSVDIPRRELFKSLSNYDRYTKILHQMFQKYEYK